MTNILETLWKRACTVTERDRRNQQTAVVWLFFWTVSWVAALIGIREGWVPAGALTMAVALLPTALGLAMILAYWKFLRHADELLRKIHLEALALGFGAGVVGAVAIHLLEETGAVGATDVTDVIVVMAVVYVLSVVLGTRRYA